jgi:hypothetical protein
MLEQVNKLIEAAQRPNIVLEVVPSMQVLTKVCMVVASL